MPLEEPMRGREDLRLDRPADRSLLSASCWSVRRMLEPNEDRGSVLVVVLYNINVITSVCVQGCDRQPFVRSVVWLTIHNRLSQDLATEWHVISDQHSC
jgi:hypothetical protein